MYFSLSPHKQPVVEFYNVSYMGLVEDKAFLDMCLYKID